MVTQLISQFTVSFSRTVNLGSFNSARVEASITIDVPKGVNGVYDDLKQKVQPELRKLLEETYKYQYTDRQKIGNV